MIQICSKSLANVGNAPAGALQPLEMEFQQFAVSCNTPSDLHAAAHKPELIGKVQPQTNPELPTTTSGSWGFQR